MRDKNGRYAGFREVYYDETAYPIPRENNNNLNVYPNLDISNIISTLNKNTEYQTQMMMNMMTNMMSSLGQIMASKMVRETEKIDTIEMIKTIKNLLNDKEEKDPIKSFDKLIEVFTKGIELGSITNKAEENESFLGLVKDVVSMINSKNNVNDVVKTFKSITEKSNNDLEVKEENQQINLKENEGEGMNITEILLNQYKKAIVELAKEGKNPEETAKMIIARIPQDKLVMAYDISCLPNRFEVAVEYIPELKEYKEWVEKVYDEGKKILEAYFILNEKKKRR